MIDVQELRIGNWLEHKFTKLTSKIDKIDGDGEVFTDSISDQFLHISAYSPILLTEELMDKLFTRSKQIMGDTAIYWKIGDFIYSLRDPFMDRGLHWLQNYHYFKTGDEIICYP